MFKRISGWLLITFVIFVAEMAFFSIFAPGFFNFANWMSMTENFLSLGVMALGEAFVMIVGGIDLSVGSTMSLTGVLMGIMWEHHVNVWLASVFGIVIGGICGGINGQLVVRTRIQPLIVTLATLFIYGSLATVLGGQGGGSIYGFPNSFLTVGTGEVFGFIPVQLIIFVALALFFGLLLQRTSYGRGVVVIGNNEFVARYSAVSVDRTKMWTYVVSGLCSGLAAIMLGSYFASMRGDMGLNMELNVITICLIGGISVFGGVGTISGIALGTFILGMLTQGLNEMNMPSAEQSIVTGAILILAVGMQQLNAILFRRRKSRSPSKEVVQAQEPA